MSISTVVTEGFGSFGTTSFVITQGFGTGAATPPVEEQRGGGSYKRKRKRVRYLSEVPLEPVVPEVIHAEPKPAPKPRFPEAELEIRAVQAEAVRFHAELIKAEIKRKAKEREEEEELIKILEILDVVD